MSNRSIRRDIGDGTQSKWSYECMHRDLDFWIDQDCLKLVKRFNWDRKIPIESTPETTSESDFKEIQ